MHALLPAFTGDELAAARAGYWCHDYCQADPYNDPPCDDEELIRRRTATIVRAIAEAIMYWSARFSACAVEQDAPGFFTAGLCTADLVSLLADAAIAY